MRKGEEEADRGRKLEEIKIRKVGGNEESKIWRNKVK